MTNRTYADLEKEVLEHFKNLSAEEFESALQKSRFEFFNKFDAHLLMPTVIEDIDPDLQETLFSGVCKIKVKVPVRLEYDTPKVSTSRWSGRPTFSHYKLAA